MTRTSADGRRWADVGASDHEDAATAGGHAVRAALTGEDAKLLIVFAADRYDPAELLRGMREAAPDVPLIGCTTAGEIRSDGAGDHHVVVTALGGPGFEIRTTVARNASADLHAAGVTAAGAALSGQGGHRAMLMLSDGLAGDQQEIVRGVYATLGATTPLVGGCSGDGLRMELTHQFRDDEVLTDAVVAAGISSDAPMGVGVRHGWTPVGERMLVTASGGNRVDRIDDRPALDVYLERSGAPTEAHTDADAFTRFAITHPLGLERRAETEVRAVASADFELRALITIAEVPQGELVWVMEGDEASVLDATDDACAGASTGLGGDEPVALLAFDCIGRRGVLGDEGIGQEMARIQDNFPGVPLAGFYTYGEFARTRGVRGFHNQTLVVLALG